MSDRIQCYALEPTGEMTPEVDGLSCPVYRRVDTGALEHTGYRDNVPGIRAMQHGAIYRDSLGLVVRTPGGTWHPERPSSSGGGWTVEGTPPNLTIRPSIQHTWPQPAGDGSMVTPEGCRAYHGFLTAGFLVEC